MNARIRPGYSKSKGMSELMASRRSTLSCACSLIAYVLLVASRMVSADNHDTIRATTIDLAGNTLACPSASISDGSSSSEDSLQNSAIADGMVRQEFQLLPGWNAIYLQVQPQDNRIEEVFQPLKSGCVFATLEQGDPVALKYDTTSVDTRTLFTAQANQTYLIKLNDTEPLAIAIDGQPVLPAIRWQSDRTAEVGLSVSGIQPVTFADYMKPSAAFDGAIIKQLTPDGSWTNVSRNQPIVPNVAYRIRSIAASSYVGPLTVEPELDNRIDFERNVREQSVILKNWSRQQRTVTLAEHPQETSLELMQWVPSNQDVNSIDRGSWKPLKSSSSIVVDPQSESVLRLAVRRGTIALGDALISSVLQFSDNFGVQIHVPLQVRQRSTRNGLWIGQAVIDKVANINRITPDLYFDLSLTTGQSSLSDQIPDSSSGIRDTLVSSQAEWHFLNTGESPALEWNQPQFDDDDWAVGKPPLGFGTHPVTSKITNHDSAVYYFRHRFSMPEAVSIPDMELRLRADDAAVVYLNGIEIARANIQDLEGAVSGSEALMRLTGSAELDFMVYSTESESSENFAHTDPASLLLPGENVISAEVHQYSEEVASGATQASLDGVSSAFSFRLLLHTDATNQVRLLKEVIQMRQMDTDEMVLLTDNTRVHEFKGTTLRDGEMVGQRISSTVFDFPDEDPAMPGTLRLQGAMTTGSTLSASIKLPADFSTNPFKHKFHPDHDNLDDGNGEPLSVEQHESYAITRELRLTFEDSEPATMDDPRWGDTLIGGRFSEMIHGLHRDPIHAAGHFVLQHVSDNDLLNPIRGSQQ